MCVCARVCVCVYTGMLFITPAGGGRGKAGEVPPELLRQDYSSYVNCRYVCVCGH